MMTAAAPDHNAPAVMRTDAYAALNGGHFGHGTHLAGLPEPMDMQA